MATGLGCSYPLSPLSPPNVSAKLFSPAPLGMLDGLVDNTSRCLRSCSVRLSRKKKTGIDTRCRCTVAHAIITTATSLVAHLSFRAPQRRYQPKLSLFASHLHRF